MSLGKLLLVSSAALVATTEASVFYSNLIALMENLDKQHFWEYMLT